MASCNSRNFGPCFGQFREIQFFSRNLADVVNYNKPFVTSYVLIVACHLYLNLRKIIVQRSYGHSLEKLTTIDYLTNDQMSFCLKCFRSDVCNQNSFDKKTLLEQYNKKIKPQQFELDLLIKINMKESIQ